MTVQEYRDHVKTCRSTGTPPNDPVDTQQLIELKRVYHDQPWRWKAFDTTQGKVTPDKPRLLTGEEQAQFIFTLRHNPAFAAEIRSLLIASKGKDAKTPDTAGSTARPAPPDTAGSTARPAPVAQPVAHGGRVPEGRPGPATKAPEPQRPITLASAVRGGQEVQGRGTDHGDPRDAGKRVEDNF